MIKKMQQHICSLCDRLRHRLFGDAASSDQARKEEEMLHNAIKRVSIESQRLREVGHG